MGTLAKDSDTCSLDPQISEWRQCFCSPSSLQLPLLLQMQGSPVPSVSMRCTSLAGWSRWGLCQSVTTLLRTTAQPLEKTKVGVRTPCPDTTLACCLLLSSTTLWTEPSMFARLEVPVTLLRSTLVTSASRALNGSRRTLRIRS